MNKTIPLSFATTILVWCFAAGCASDQAYRYYSTEKFPAKPSQEVEVLRAAPPRPYTVIADFQLRGASEALLRKEAAAIGADAIIVTDLGGYYARDEKWAGSDRHKNSKSRTVATAIKYK